MSNTETARDTAPKGINWPELWGLWMFVDDAGDLDPLGGGWVMAAVGVEDGPEVYWTEKEAQSACNYNQREHGITCIPRRVFTEADQ